MTLVEAVSPPSANVRTIIIREAMAGSRGVEDVVEVVVPHLQDALASEIRKLAQQLSARAEEARAETEAEHEASLARERRRAMAERAQAIAAAVAVAREQAALGVVTRLRDALNHLDEQTTLSGVLDALAELAGAEAGRAALFVAAEGGLQSWRLVGFDAPADETGRVLSAADAGVAGRAIDERRNVAVSRGAGDGAQGDGAGDRSPVFAALAEECTGVAVPVLIGGEPLVAVYADDGTAGRGSDSARWIAVVEILARHAGSRLEALAAERAAALARFAVAPASQDAEGDADGAAG